MATAQDAAAASPARATPPLSDAEGARADTPAAAAVMARVGGENFPVASLVLPRRVRAHLLALYGFARLVDELGDEAQGERLAALDWLQEELDAAYAGGAGHPLMCTLSVTLRECELPRDPFLRLIEANRVDQRVTRYETWEQLQGYCALSANPVGELVLGVFGLASPERIALSDRICTALQLVEHCQDVAEDLRRGRIYMPAQDMRRCGCGEQDLHASHADEHVRALIALQTQRVHELLAQGAPLLDTLRGRSRLAVAAFIAGGRAAALAIERAGFDVLAGVPTASGRARLRALFTVLSQRPAARRHGGTP
ncbi:MAG: squalene synthase HpnC [Solirubrobacteraceae bacterium]